MIDLPEEMLDFFGSMINMDNPRHARLRRIVSAAFNPRMIKSIEDRIELVANDVIDRVADKGGCDFVVEVASRLPLEIICDMMGIAAADYDTVFNALERDPVQRRPRVRARGRRPDGRLHDGGPAAQPAHDRTWPSSARSSPTEDVTSALVNTNVDGEALTDTEVAAFFILLVVAGQRDDPQRHQPRAAGHDRSTPTSGRCGRPTRRASRPPAWTRSCAGVRPSSGCAAPWPATPCSAGRSWPRATR